MKFNKPADVCAVVKKMTEADQPRGENRRRIASLFNGDPPFSEDERKKLNLAFSVNFMEAAKVAHTARSVYYAGFVDTPTPLSITFNTGEPDKRQVWGNWLTQAVNCKMSECSDYLETQREKFAQVVLYGIGPMMWCDYGWKPKSIPLSDIRIPSNTKRSMCNLGLFAVRMRLTAGEITEMTSGDHVDSGWKKAVVQDLVKQSLVNKPEGIGTVNETFSINESTPEQLANWIREHSGLCSSDALPTIEGWDFYYKNDGGKWNRCIVFDLKPDQFAYSKDNYSESLDQIIHFQFGDGNNTAPFTYHSVRGIGFMLYAIMEITNRLRCAMLGSTFLDQKTLFKNVGEGDRERIQSIELTNLGAIPDGLSIVPANERYGTNVQLGIGTLTGLRQLASEHSTAFTQQLDAGGAREMTAQEVLARQNVNRSLTSAILNQAYTSEQFADTEIVRRMLTDTDFIRECVQAGIPIEMLDKKHWKVTRNRQVGSGDRQMQMTMAQSLMAVIDRLDPEAQRTVLRIYAEAFSDVPGMGHVIVPPVQQTNTPSREKASFAWGTLMDGQDVTIAGAINAKEYLDTLVQMLTGRVNQFIETQQVPSIDVLNGFSMVIEHCEMKLQEIARDPSAQELVKVIGDMLGRVKKMVLDWSSEESQAQNQKGEDGEDADVMKEMALLNAKVQSMMTLAEAQARIKESSAAQKRQHTDMKFLQGQKMKEADSMTRRALSDAETAARIVRENAADLGKPEKKEAA